MKWEYDDGGRVAAGFSEKKVGDCVCRSIAIATGLSYKEVHCELNHLAFHHERRGKKKRDISNARDGVYKQTIRRFMSSIGWSWTPTMFIGQGCRVHLKEDELPAGRLVVNLSKHVTAVIDGVIRDTYDPSREGTRCVYGVWSESPLNDFFEQRLKG